jgi:hypothetical protein
VKGIFNNLLLLELLRQELLVLTESHQDKQYKFEPDEDAKQRTTNIKPINDRRQTIETSSHLVCHLHRAQWEEVSLSLSALLFNITGLEWIFCA